jgi:DNA-binding transcriptional ArsR family regulator
MPNSKLSPYELLLESDTRFKIWLQLSLNSEMNLGELSRQLKRSKSTIHEHLQKLLEAELIIETREESVQGRIPSKFYSLDPDYSTKLSESPEIKFVSDRLDLQKAIKFINGQKAITRMNQQILKYKMQFHDFIERKLSSKDPIIQDKYLKILNDLRFSEEKAESRKYTSDVVDYFEFYSDEIYYEFMRDLLRLGQKYEDKQHDLFKKNPKMTRQFYISSLGLPLKKIMNILQDEK